MEKDEIRLSWIDLSKGILICLVIVGHLVPGPHWKLNNPVDYVYLFHMPAFFILSGILYKKKEKIQISEIIKKKVKRLLLPYISYVFVVSIGVIIYNIIKRNEDFNYIKFIIKQFLGGQYLSYCGALWFLTCLFFVEVIWLFLDSMSEKKYLKLAIVILFYILAHIQSWKFSDVAFPFAFDIGFIGIAYYYIGTILKRYVFNKIVIITSFIIAILSILLINLGYFKYGLELWGHHYINFIFDLIIPVSLSVVLFFISKILSMIKIFFPLQQLGRITLPIMAMHEIIIIFISKYLNNNIILEFAITLTISVIVIDIIFKKSRLLSSLFGV